VRRARVSSPAIDWHGACCRRIRDPRLVDLRFTAGMTILTLVFMVSQGSCSCTS
jgi:hypothetical protein